MNTQQPDMFNGTSTYPRIETLSIGAPMRYLWLKYINAVDLDRHCINTFVGPRSKKFKPAQGTYTDIILNEAESQVYYLCGVSWPYVWGNNFHLAMQASAGDSFTMHDKGVTVTVRDARRLAIPEGPLPHPRAEDYYFRTCRNWQFAMHYHMTGGRPEAFEQ